MNPNWFLNICSMSSLLAGLACIGDIICLGFGLGWIATWAMGFSWVVSES
jgi:hypothetical protein